MAFFLGLLALFALWQSPTNIRSAPGWVFAMLWVGWIVLVLGLAALTAGVAVYR